MRTKRRTTHATATLAAILMAAAGAHAQTTTQTNFDLPAQSLTDSLRAVGKLTDTNILLDRQEVGNRRAPAIRGNLTVKEVLARLLEGTGLEPRFVEEKTVVVGEAKPAPGVVAKPTAAAAEGTTPLRLSQAKEFAVKPARADTDPGVSSTPADDIETKGIPEVLVKGSQSLNADIERSRDDPQPYVVFSQQDLWESGAGDVGSFLRMRLAADPAPTLGTQADINSPLGNASQIDLRGLGVAQTLILIDGHRAVGYGIGGTAGQPDLNAIPLSAISRIEVLPATASGIYGGGATGGVVNVVLRHDYRGVGVSVSDDYSNGTRPSRRVDVSAGTELEGGRTSLTLIGSYSDSAQLATGDRSFYFNGRKSLSTINPQAVYGTFLPPLGTTTNIESADGSPLVLKTGAALNSPITYVPNGYSGIASDGGAAFVPNAAAYNLGLANTAQSDGGRKQEILNGTLVKQLQASVRREMSTVLDVYLSATASNNQSDAIANLVNSSFVIPAAAPNNPFVQDIFVTTPALGADQSKTSSLQTLGLNGGLIAKIGTAWRANVDLTWGRTILESSIPGSGVLPAAADAVAAGEIDVLRDTNRYPVEFLQFAPPPTITFPAHSTFDDVTAKIAGPLLRLPGGPLTFSASAEARHERYEEYTVQQYGYNVIYPSQAQSVYSAYLEGVIPIVSPINNLAGIDSLELQVAARYDRYSLTGANSILEIPDVTPSTNAAFASDSFSKIEPTFAIKYRPVHSVMFRSSFARGFLPPALAQLVPNAPITFDVSGLSDPRRGGEPVSSITFYSGGNPDLRPEQSQSISAGLVLTPDFARGLRISVDRTRIKKKENITTVATLTEQDLLNEAAIPGLVVRGPPTAGDPYGVGPVIGINNVFRNISSQTNDAYDLSLEYTLSTASLGALTFSLAATDLVSNSIQATSSSPLIQFAGTATYPRWNGNAQAVYRRRNWTLGWAARFLDSAWFNLQHEVNVSTDRYKFSSQVYHDVFVEYDLGGSAPVYSIIRGMQITLGARNLFNEAPQNTGAFNFYDTRVDPRLRTIWMSIRADVGR